MIVRNYLVLLPFFAIFAAAGLEWLFNGLSDKLKHRFPPARKPVIVLVSAGILVIIFLNARQVYNASESIVMKDKEKVELFNQQFIDFLDEHSDQTFLFELDVYEYLTYVLHQETPPKLMAKKDAVENEDDWVVFSNANRESEKLWRDFKANIADYSIADFGQQDINFNYYPSFSTLRIVVMKFKYAKNLHLSYY